MLLRRVVHQWFHTILGYLFESLRWITLLLQFKTEPIEHSNLSDNYGTPHGIWALHWSENGAYAKLPFSLSLSEKPLGANPTLQSCGWLRNTSWSLSSTLNRERSICKTPFSEMNAQHFGSGNSTLLVLLPITMPSLSNALDLNRKHNIKPWQ